MLSFQRVENLYIYRRLVYDRKFRLKGFLLSYLALAGCLCYDVRNTNLTTFESSKSEAYILAGHSMLNFISTIIFISAIVLSLEVLLLDWVLHGLSNEEISHGYLGSPFMSALVGLVDLIGLEPAVTLTVTLTNDIDRLKDFWTMLVCYCLLAVGVDIIMQRCHSLCYFLKRNDVRKEEKLDEFEKIFYVGIILFCVNLWFAYQSFDGFIRYHDLFYIHFTLRFIHLLSNETYTFLWCLSSLDLLNRPNIAGYPWRQAQIMNQQRTYQQFRVYLNLLGSIALCFIVVKLHSKRYLLTLFNIVLRNLPESLDYFTGYTPSGSLKPMLLNYLVHPQWKFQGVKHGEIYYSNTDCVVCFEEMVPNDKTPVCFFFNDDAVKIPCGHNFHYGCLSKWLETKKICPTCAQSVEDVQPDDEMSYTELFPMNDLLHILDLLQMIGYNVDNVNVVHFMLNGEVEDELNYMDSDNVASEDSEWVESEYEQTP